MTTAGDRHGGTGAEAWAEEVCAILREQRGLLERLDGLSRAQAEFVRADEAERLLTVLRAKDGVIAAIAECVSRLTPLRERWGAMLAALDPARRESVRAAAAEVDRAAAQISARDESDREALSERRAAVAEELRGLARGRGAVSAYGGVGVGARFQDKEA